jgi:(2R)-sulfolactate sulfo-lyase subunit alpha
LHSKGKRRDRDRQREERKESEMIDFLVHEKKDLVGVATVDIKAGQVAKGVYMDTQEPIEVKAVMDIPLGHKIALVDLKVGDTVLKYGSDIGKVVAPIKKGEHVHVHNLKTKRW